jgi:hypothetical protein
MHSAHYLFGSKPKKSTILTLLNLVKKIKVFAMYGLCIEEGKVYILNKAKQRRTKKALHFLKE